MVAANNISMFNAETNKQSNNEGNSNIYDGKHVSNKFEIQNYLTGMRLKAFSLH